MHKQNSFSHPSSPVQLQLILSDFGTTLAHVQLLDTGTMLARLTRFFISQSGCLHTHTHTHTNTNKKKGGGGGGVSKYCYYQSCSVRPPSLKTSTLAEISLHMAHEIIPPPPRTFPSDLRSCVKVKEAVLGSLSLTGLIVCNVSVDVKQHWTWTASPERRSCVEV